MLYTPCKDYGGFIQEYRIKAGLSIEQLANNSLVYEANRRKHGLSNGVLHGGISYNIEHSLL